MKIIKTIIRLVIGLILSPFIGLFTMLLTIAFMGAPKNYRDILLSVFEQFTNEALITIKFLNKDKKNG